MCCYRSRLVFSCCFYDTDISQGSSYTLNWGVVRSLVTILLQKFSWFWKWTSLKIAQYLTTYPTGYGTKQCASFWLPVIVCVNDSIRTNGGTAYLYSVQRRHVRTPYIYASRYIIMRYSNVTELGYHVGVWRTGHRVAQKSKPLSKASLNRIKTVIEARWGRWNRETWHRETWKNGTISQGWTSRDLTRRHQIKQHDWTTGTMSRVALDG